MMAILGQRLLYIIILCGVFGLLCDYHNTGAQQCSTAVISKSMKDVKV